MDEYSMNNFSTTVGIDLGDTYSAICVLDHTGEIVVEERLRMDRERVIQRFDSIAPSRIVLESGTHSRWMSHLLKELGHEVIVANARRLRMIYASENKTDKLDAHVLARVGRFDVKLLSAIEHRTHQAHVDMEQLKARELLVTERKRLITHIRSIVKTFGYSLPSCDTQYFCSKTRAHIPEQLDEVMGALYEVIEMVNEKIRGYDKQIDTLGHEQYPETQLLRNITGVGPITSLAYVLTIENPNRFAKSRDVGSYFGLRPRLSQSGERDPQLPITKCGNSMVRRLLVQAAHYILGPFGPDCDLRRFGLRIAEHGGKRAKKIAVIAVARKLSVLLHRLWLHGEIYDPLHNSKLRAECIA
jgi:transposase